MNLREFASVVDQKLRARVLPGCNRAPFLCSSLGNLIKMLDPAEVSTPHVQFRAAVVTSVGGARAGEAWVLAEQLRAARVPDLIKALKQDGTTAAHPSVGDIFARAERAAILGWDVGMEPVVRGVFDAIDTLCPDLVH